ncbi:hypothetical protein ACW9HO_35820 [Nocardia gipuzkoensis]
MLTAFRLPITIEQRSMTGKPPWTTFWNSWPTFRPRPGPHRARFGIPAPATLLPLVAVSQAKPG